MLKHPCHTLPGVGPALAAKLQKCGIQTLQDLLFHLPFRYQDRTRVTPIQDLRVNDWCVISGRVRHIEVKYGKRMMLYCSVEDKTGLLRLRFFHFNKQQVQQLRNSQQIRAFGEVRSFAQTLEMIHPEYQLFQDHETCPVEETLTPIYATTQGLSQARLRQLIQTALSLSQTALLELEWMSQKQLQTHSFQSLTQAIHCLHHPPPDISLKDLDAGKHPALKRLAFDELLAERLSLQFARQQRETLSAPVLTNAERLKTQFIHQLPFELTQAQKRVCDEIASDLAQDKPMLRLVQGDVGAGKTVIAAIAALQAIDEGYQVAFMAPTDLLSEQHAQNMMTWLSPLNVSIHRLSGKMKARERTAALTALANHQCQLIIGTHALFQDNVHFARLGLIIIDEQHRFGVAQRLLLQKKGQQAQHLPHQLLMTATPIPRTLSMTQLAHLDLSTLDELPPGRIPVITSVMSQNKRQLVIERLRTAVNQGRQVYWVCTLIEASEKLQCIAATASAESLKDQLPELRIGLIHGRMKISEKESIMTEFKSGDLDILVATTVIEVGVDVANASLMIIENAERLGLSQLHQLRGRVGRGSAQAHCLLLYQSPISNLGMERLRVMKASHDGFFIAEKDLELRGSGEILGTRQTGDYHYKIANLSRDQALLPLLKNAANQLIRESPTTAKIIAKRWLGEFEAFFQVG